MRLFEAIIAESEQTIHQMTPLMKLKRNLTQALGLILLTTGFSLQASPNKTEAQLIEMIQSGDFKKMNDGIDRLSSWYPNSTNAIRVLKEVLRSNDLMLVSQPVITNEYRWKSGPGVALSMSRPPPAKVLVRIAARALGKCHAKVDADDLNIICGLLKSRDPETVMDALKALRGLDAPQAVPEILPLLDDQDNHVVRDACKTLAVIGNRSVILRIEPLLKSQRSDIKWDAQAAIEALQEKR